MTLHEHAADADVARVIRDVLDHMGVRSPYRGGRQLLDLLATCRGEASRVRDERSEAGLADALGYATGTVLEDDLVHRYALYDFKGQDDVRMMERVARGLRGLAAEEIAMYLRDHPAASAADVQRHLADQKSTLLRFVRARRAGHYGAYRIRTDAMAWVVDVLADRVRFEPGPVLEFQIEARLHERAGKAVTNFARILPEDDSDLAQQATRDPYLFDFLSTSEIREVDVSAVDRRSDNPPVHLVVNEPADRAAELVLGPRVGPGRPRQVRRWSSR